MFVANAVSVSLSLVASCVDCFAASCCLSPAERRFSLSFPAEGEVGEEADGGVMGGRVRPSVGCPLADRCVRGGQEVDIQVVC